MGSGWGVCLFAVGVWGITFATTKSLLTALPPTEILVARFAVGYAALWALAPRRLPWQGWRTEAWLALAGVLGIALYFHFENLALLHARAGLVAVVVCTSPLLTALGARLLGCAGPLGWRYWAGFALAAAGVTLTVTGGHVEALRGAWQGVALGLAGAAAWAAYTLLPLPKGGLPVTRRTFFWGLLAMAPLAWPEAGAWRAAPVLDPAQAARLLFLGLVASALCYAAWNAAVARLGGVRATLCLYLNPVVGVLAAALFLGEPLDLPTLSGVALTLAGVFVSTRAA